MEHSSDAIADLLIQALGDINPVSSFRPDAVGQRLYQVEGYGPGGEQVGREFTSHEMQTVLNNFRHGQWTITIDQLEKESVPDPVVDPGSEPSDDVRRYLPPLETYRSHFRDELYRRCGILEADIGEDTITNCHRNEATVTESICWLTDRYELYDGDDPEGWGHGPWTGTRPDKKEEA